MNNRLFTFLNKNQLIYSFLFGFRQKNLTTNASINLTELLRKQSNEGNYDCDSFFDFQNGI